MKNFLLSCFLLFVGTVLTAQTDSRMLPQGIVFPRLSQAEMQASSATLGQCIYNTTFNAIFCFNGSIWRNVDTTNSFNERVFDNDLDTGIETALSPDDDLLRFFAGGVDEVMRHDGKTLHILNTGESVFIGEEAGKFDDGSTNRNTSVGHHAGQLNTTGSNNVALGNQALRDNASGNNNVALGKQALFKTTQSNNVGIGLNAGLNSVSGDKNTLVGGFTGADNVAGDENTYVGYEAGRGITGQNPSGNVMIGHQAGKNENESNRLYIANDDTDEPLVLGKFDESILRVHGNLQVNNPDQSGFELPAEDGSPNQVLATDGNGTVDWTNVSSGGGGTTDCDINADHEPHVAISPIEFRFFLDLPSIPGDSQATGHVGEIECYGYELKQLSGQPCEQISFKITKGLDRATPELRRRVSQGLFIAGSGADALFYITRFNSTTEALETIHRIRINEAFAKRVERKVSYAGNGEYRVYEELEFLLTDDFEVRYVVTNPNGSTSNIDKTILCSLN